MVTAAETDLVGSVVEAALMVTLPPVGTLLGAVNVVAIPLAVCAGLNEPQLEIEQVTVQSTPPLEESFVTVTLTCAVALVLKLLGGACVKATLMPGGPMVNVNEIEGCVPPTAVAMIVTEVAVCVAGGL